MKKISNSSFTLKKNQILGKVFKEDEGECGLIVQQGASLLTAEERCMEGASSIPEDSRPRTVGRLEFLNWRQPARAAIEIRSTQIGTAVSSSYIYKFDHCKDLQK